MRSIYSISILATLLFAGGLWSQGAERVSESKAENPAAEKKDPSKTDVKPVETADEQRLPDVVVTASKEEEPRREVPMAIGALPMATLKDVKPIHPSEIMNRVPGVFVNTTSGEGHATMIRHPITTGSVYLYLEDGVPSRSPGFFNHNALYELNLPQAGTIEVIKGPGSALYGSDAIGGVVNVMTKPVTRDREIDLSGEYGGFGWKRVLASVGEKFGDHSLRVDANMTDSKGWRDGTKYSRQSGTLRWDFSEGRNRLKTVVSASNIDQQSAGVAQVNQSDYDNNPQVNYMPMSYRRVKAVRVSSQYEHDFSNASMLRLTVYGRYNEMALLPNYLGGGTTNQLESNLRNASVGFMPRHHLDINVFRSKLITGADLEYSPGVFNEWGLSTTKSGNYFTSYSTNALQYDYAVKFYQASPYAQFETSPLTQKLRLNVGARYDYMGYAYSNNLSTVQTGTLRRPGDTSPSYNHLSPKAGVVFDVIEELNLFASYRHGFRVPTQSDLFRQAGSNNTVGLQPVKVDSYEVGIRGSTLKQRLIYEVTGYYARKTDDIVTYQYTDAAGAVQREVQNAGATDHKGIEFGLEAEIWKKVLSLAGNFTYAEHRYASWTNSTVVYDGKLMSLAPNMISTIALKVKPATGLQVELEWVYLGRYFMDDANTTEYAGHNFFNVRAKYDVNERFGVFTRVHNITNVKYSDYSTLVTGSNPLYTPGEPFSVIGGMSYKL